MPQSSASRISAFAQAMGSAPLLPQPSADFLAIAQGLTQDLGDAKISFELRYSRQGSLRCVVNYAPPVHRQHCLRSRSQLVRFVADRLRRLNLAAYPELSNLDLQIFGYVVESKEILWQEVICLDRPLKTKSFKGNPQGGVTSEWKSRERMQHSQDFARPPGLDPSQRAEDPRPQGSLAQSHHIQPHRHPEKRGQTERGQTERGQAERGQAERGQANRRPRTRDHEPRGQRSRSQTHSAHTSKTGRPVKPRMHSAGHVVMTRLAIAGFLMSGWLLYRYLSGPAVVKVPSNPAIATAAALQNSAPKPSPHIVPSQISFTAPAHLQGQLIDQITVAPGQKVVALTFDDGPWPRNTEQILDILELEGIKATFYMVGRAVQNNPEIGKKVVAAGHAIGNHTWRHPQVNLDQLSAAEEIANTAKILSDKLGVKTMLFRPPGGNTRGQLVPYAKSQKNVVTLWTVESSDYYASAAEITQNVVKNIKPGAIVLLHDGGGDRKPTIKALPQIIAQLKAQGYSFVTVPELMTLQVKPKLATTADTNGSSEATTAGNGTARVSTSPDNRP